MSPRDKLLAISDQLNETFVQREQAIRTILLGVVSRQNYILVGPPGTAKTSVIDRFTMHVEDATPFKILMGRFTQPEHVFGVLDISEFKAGRYKTVTDGMMPTAQFPILDEALKASDGCMNSLLGILGPEREFQSERAKTVCTGAATNWPEIETMSPNVEALWDRFLLRCIVEPVRGDAETRRSLYRSASQVNDYKPRCLTTVDELRDAASEAEEIEVSDSILDLLDGLVGRLANPPEKNAHRVTVSDRRATQLLAVLKANAWLDGRDRVGLADFVFLRHGLWTVKNDVEVVVGALDTIDAAQVQLLTDAIDEVRTEFSKHRNSSAIAPALLNDLIRKFADVAKRAKTAMDEPVFTDRGRKQVTAAMKHLKQDFNTLKGMVK